MTKKEKIELLNEIKDNKNQLSKCFNTLDNIFCCVIEGDLSDATWKSIDLSIKMASKILGVTEDDLFWFIYDDEMGKNGYSVWVDEKEYIIDSIESYIDYIEKVFI